MSFAHRPTPKNEDDNLVWKIAAGVVLGLIVFFGLQRCVDEYRARQAIAAMNAELAKIEVATRSQRELNERHARERAERQQRREGALLLGPDERCVGGKRFRRLPNGWAEVPHKPCQ